MPAAVGTRYLIATGLVVARAGWPLSSVSLMVDPPNKASGVTVASLGLT